jgi:hypothetical protein
MRPINFVTYAAVAAAFLLAGCSHHVPQATVELVDTSLSITTRAERAALGAVEMQIGNMQRGDQLVLIPISGDAANDAGGRVLRLSAPNRRETYDADLRRFQAQARSQFTSWTESLDQHQSRTDILGALDVARQEFAALPNRSIRRLIVVSDFLEDDGAYRFVSDHSVANPAHARELAEHLRKQNEFALQSVPLCLGRLESSDFAPLSAQRKEAVRAFWRAYFASGGEPVEIQIDGAGILADMQRSCSNGKW